MPGPLAGRARSASASDDRHAGNDLPRARGHGREVVTSVHNMPTAEFAGQLRSDLAGKVSAELVEKRLSSQSHVEGTGPTAFAIGCAELGLDPGKNVVRLRKNKTLRAAATEVVGTRGARAAGPGRGRRPR